MRALINVCLHVHVLASLLLLQGIIIGGEEPEPEASEMQSLTDDDTSPEADERRAHEPLQQ